MGPGSLRAAAAAALLLAFGAACIAAGAQEYNTPAPAPRTTSLPALRRFAAEREIRERFGIGLDAERRGQWSAAAAEFQRIVQLNPREPQGSTARYDLALAYANMHRYADAAAQLKDALRLDPGFLAAMANLIAVDLARNDLRDARAVADRFVAIAPDSARALYSRGIVALRSGDAGAAQADFGKLLRSDPQYAVAHYDLALAQIHAGQFASAERELLLALDLAPSYARARFALGAVYLREGRRADARSAFNRVVKDASSDPALENLALSMRDAINAH